jgi:hypothetical protein
MTAGTLVIDDPVQAARRFNWLVMAEPPSRSQIEEWATDGVAAFLAIYPARGGGAAVDP